MRPAAGCGPWPTIRGWRSTPWGARRAPASARFAGPAATDADRIREVLTRLADVPWPRRTARFRCVIALARPGEAPVLVEGRVEGYIAFEPRGSSGFGYDPIFYIPELGKTMAELPMEVKNRISHRARAARKAREILERWLREEACEGSC
jgi:XTP/dITP diphosphohydrolase